MKFKIYIDRKNIKCGLTIELPEPYFILECLIFEANPSMYVPMLNAVHDQQSFNTEKSGMRFKADLDWEDEEKGIFLNDDQVYIFNHEFGDLIMGISDFREVVVSFFRKYLEAQKINPTMDQNDLAAIADQLARLGLVFCPIDTFDRFGGYAYSKTDELKDTGQFGILAACAIAVDATGFTIEVESDYIPRWLYIGEGIK